MNGTELITIQVDFDRLHKHKFQKCPCLNHKHPDSELIEHKCPCDNFTKNKICRCGIFRAVETTPFQEYGGR